MSTIGLKNLCALLFLALRALTILGKRLEGTEKRLDAKIDAVDARLHQFEKNVTEKFGSIKVWMLGLYIGQAASLLAILAKGFKWI